MYLSFFPSVAVFNDFLVIVVGIGLMFHFGWDLPEIIYSIGAFIVRIFRRLVCVLRKTK